MPEQGGCYVYPGSGIPIIELMTRMQQGFWLEEHFDGQIPDGNKSGQQSYLELVTGGGTADAGGVTAIGRPGGIGQGTLGLPARAIPVAADGAGFQLRASATAIVLLDDMVGEIGFIWRVQNDNPPQAGSDYLLHYGVVDAEANQAESSDGFYVFGDNTSANWILKHRRAGAEVLDDSGLAMATATWQTLGAILTVDEGIVSLFGADDGSPIEKIAEVTPANVQPAVALTSMGTMHNPGNVTLATVLNVDYIGFGNRYGTFR